MKLLTAALLVAVVGACFVSCCDTEEQQEAPVEPTQSQIIQGSKGIIPLESGYGYWDAAFITSQGYFTYRENLGASGNSANGGGRYQTLSYLSPDGDDYVSLVSTKDGDIPTQMLTKGGVYYFSFPNDTILELLYDNGGGITMLDSIPYNKPELFRPSSDDYVGKMKGMLLNIAGLLGRNNCGDGDAKGRIDRYSAIFSDVARQPIVEDGEIVSRIDRGENGEYVFSNVLKEWYEPQVDKAAFNTLSLWTGKATFKVGGSSCTLSGTIWCPSGAYNRCGTYGILCDSNPDNLYLGRAEFEAVGYQHEDSLSYSVDFRGFKPNTTYYYRAYYMFEGGDRGNISVSHGSPTADVVYDTEMKNFQTGDNRLTVDVVMCIDVTGSMSGIINTVKSNAISFYDLFNESCVEEGITLTGLNVQVVAFRDSLADSDWLVTSPTYTLPGERDAYNEFVRSLYADGGGDEPESGLEALNRAFDKKDWGVDDGYHRQVVILWTDASYLKGSSYSNLTASYLESKWDKMPSGRRLVLFAPEGVRSSNGGDWRDLNDWKNVIHETDLTSGFNDFEYILKSIIGELTSKDKASAAARGNSAVRNYWFRPNN